MSITLVTKTSHWTLYRTQCIYSASSHITSLRYTLILSSYLRPVLQSRIIPSDFPTEFLFEFLFFLMSRPSHPPWFVHPNITCVPVSMAERSKAFYSLRPLEHWDRRFESCFGHGCVSAYFCVVLSCVGRGLASGWSPVQGVLPKCLHM
jgi:hypothetical protein